MVVSKSARISHGKNSVFEPHHSTLFQFSFLSDVHSKFLTEVTMLFLRDTFCFFPFTYVRTITTILFKNYWIFKQDLFIY